MSREHDYLGSKSHAVVEISKALVPNCSVCVRSGHAGRKEDVGRLVMSKTGVTVSKLGSTTYHAKHQPSSQPCRSL